jgi:hypothetical protein
MDTQISRTWWQAIDKLKLHQHTLDQVGKGLSFASFIASAGSITLSAMEAMNQEIATVHLTLIAKTLEDMEGQGEYFSLAFKQALKELIQENDSSFIAEFTHNLYYEWEKNKDKVTEKGLALFMQTTGKKAITTTLQKAGLSHAALPALAWSLSIQYSYHVIQSGLKGIDLFHRYVMTTDTLFYLRKMRNYAYANQQTADYLSFNLLDATSQLYAYQLLEALMNTTPQKLMFWKLGARKLVLEEITATQEELKSLFPLSPLPPEEPEKPEMVTWERTFGGSENDMANDIIQTADGGYAICGYTESKSAGRKDIWLLRLDSKGNLLWDRNYGGSKDDEATSLVQTDDGGFVVAGCTLSYGAGWEDFWVLRLDSLGNIIWDKTFGRENDDEIYTIVQVEDGYVIAGHTGYYGYNYWLIKLDNYGEIVWQRIFGTESGRYWKCFLIQTNDGGYALTGHIDHDSCLIKLDKKGNIVWEKTYGGNEDDYTCSIIQNKDDGYVLAGFTESKGEGSRDAWVIKLDSQGDIIWDRTYGGRDDDYAFSLIQTTDGGYTVAGYTYSKGAGKADAWVIKLDSQGNKVWDKTFGGSSYDEAHSIIQTTDGGYAVAGYTQSKGAGELDAWVIKLDELFIPEETSKEEDTLKATYTLHDTGPAGGIIFYDKGSYSDGWRYLEAAPVSTECKGKEWSKYDTLIGGTETSIGTGQSNTAKIVKWLNSSYDSYYGRDRAAQLCYYLTEGGYRDWFLPSKDELNLMYKNLKVNGVGDFADSGYWSSSEYATYGAWYQVFDDGNQDYARKDNVKRVRAVRAF